MRQKNIALLFALLFGLSLALACEAGDQASDPARTDDRPWLKEKQGNQGGGESGQTYSRDEIMSEVEGFFAGTTRGLAEMVDKAFSEQGRPSGFIKGTEGGGAFIIGLRYGEGRLYLKNGARKHLYWQGPSLGVDVGGNVSKVFTLVYNLRDPNRIFQRFPGVDGSLYVVGGFSMNYQKVDNIVLAPIRTGVGLRIGANIGYLHYTRYESINPF